ncbi:MAG: hypothetical protein KER_02463 [Kerstersia gyiorum]|uniref:hypothetical protein n=1 Tax=Kerstersia gyiorum TaxID=206506 RepID=UPI0030D2DC02
MTRHHITYPLTITTLTVALAACGGGGSSDSSQPSTPTPEPAEPGQVSLQVQQLPAGASVALEYRNGNDTLATFDFTDNGSRVLATYDRGNVLRINTVTPPQPQAHLLQCRFTSTDLGTIDPSGTSLTLTANPPATDTRIAVACGRIQLIHDMLEDGGTQTWNNGTQTRAYVQQGWLQLDVDHGRIDWLKDTAGETVIYRNFLDTTLFNLNTVNTAYPDFFQGKLFFLALDQNYGREWWSTTGTASSTKVYADTSDSPNGPSEIFTNVANKYFYIQGPGNGTTTSDSLVRHDGNPETESVPVTINGGQLFNAPRRASAVATGNQLFFFNNKTETLYVKNIDTDEEAKLVKNVKDWNNRYGSTDTLLNVIGKKLFVLSLASRPYLAVVDTDTHAINTLFDSSDTTLVKGNYLPEDNAAIFNGALHFVRKDATSGQQQLWRSNGSADASGTLALSTFANGETLSFLTPTANALFFLASNGSQETLWRLGSDGKLNAVAADKIHPQIILTAPNVRTTIASLHPVGERVVFVGTDGHLWSSDGTSAGTQRLFSNAVSATSPFPATDACASGQCSLTGVLSVANDKLLISARVTESSATVTTYRQQYWLTDGTPTGTQAVRQADTEANFVHTFTLPIR